jgi:hypothetical protein
MSKAQRDAFYECWKWLIRGGGTRHLNCGCDSCVSDCEAEALRRYPDEPMCSCVDGYPYSDTCPIHGASYPTPKAEGKRWRCACGELWYPGSYGTRKIEGKWFHWDDEVQKWCGPVESSEGGKE